MNLGVMLADCSQRYPDRIAVICGDRRITFSQLEDRAKRLANALMAEGLVKGQRVALYLPNSAELVEAMAGVMLAGGLMVPISTRLTTPEVSFIFEDCEPSFVFFAPQFRDAARAASLKLDKVQMVAMEAPEADELGFEALTAAGSTDALPAIPPDDDDCVIGYTSGTTGRPKGAIATHRNMIMVHGLMNPVECRLTGADRILVTTPMAHRTGLGRIANMFCLGSSIVIMPSFNPVEAVDLIEREGVTGIGCVPTIARLLAPEIERRPEACVTLRSMMATGEVFPVGLKKRLLTALPNFQIFSFFAQTESGFVACLRPEEQGTHPESVGRAVPGVEIRIVDENLNDLPDGEAGEVLVRCGMPGEIMTMREYYKRPEANRETLLDGGWVRTGDVFRRDPDGYLYFVDRAKDMIVSGGLNIYSKEVELALIDHQSVADAAVIGVPDAEFGESVMAFVQLENGETVSPEELISHCREQIASYKKPKYVRFIDALPVTGTGKVQKQELRRSVESEFAVDAAALA
ncbi:MAG: AMP-binding protein [Rhodospirillales bacterium]|nr:AMP-binding protein [Rhodospirillales bacterium]